MMCGTVLRDGFWEGMGIIGDRGIYSNHILPAISTVPRSCMYKVVCMYVCMYVYGSGISEYHSLQ